MFHEEQLRPAVPQWISARRSFLWRADFSASTRLPTDVGQEKNASNRSRRYFNSPHHAYDPTVAMRLTLGKGVTAIYRAKVSPVSISIASAPLCRRNGVRCVQIKAAPLGEPTVVNGVNLPISSTPSSASSAGENHSAKSSCHPFANV